MAHGLHHPQPGPHRPLGVIFVRPGVAEIDQQAIAEILRNMSFITGNHLGAGLLVGAHHRAQVFRVELAGEPGRVHQVTKQHGELAPFGVRKARLSWCGGSRDGLACLDGRLMGCLWQRCDWCQCRPSVAGPDKNAAVLIGGHPLGVDQFFLQVFEVVVIQSEPAFQRPVGHAPLALEECDDLLQNIIECHNGSSTSSQCVLTVVVMSQR